MTDEEDKKEAALISVELSTQLIAASLAFIAITGGIITFVLSNRQPNWLFYLLYIISLLAFVASMFFGGKGIQFVKKNGESGNWKTKDNETHNWFDYQTKLILLGIVLVLFLPFTGNKVEKKNKKLCQIKEILKADLKNRSEFREFFTTSDSLKNLKIEEMEKRIYELEKRLKEKKHKN